MNEEEKKQEMESAMEIEENEKEEDRKDSHVEDEEDEQDGEAEGDGDEEIEGSGMFGEKSRRGRSVTLQMLMADGTLRPGDGTMCVEYLGKKFLGDLLPDGKIRWQENKEIFGSPSAWASHCKRILNPEKKSGCGWASIKYKGSKLDSLKTLWLEKHNKSYVDESKSDTKHCHNDVSDVKVQTHSKELSERINETTGPKDGKKENGRRCVVKHSTLGNRTSDHDTNILVECTPFCALGKIQPFTVTVTTNCLFLMDFHCHLTSSEVVGYLAGNWDVNSHNLSIQYAFPCRCRLGDKENAPFVEEEIRQCMEKKQLLLVGWYHSHPAASVHPTLKDIDCQMDYQIKLKGDSDACYTPCVGVICSPYDKDCKSLESSIQAYWVMPPPENKPHEYGKPMLMTFSLIQENILSSEVKQELQKLRDYYREAPDLIQFDTKWDNDITYTEKLKKSLSQKAPMDQIEACVDDIIQSVVKQDS